MRFKHHWLNSQKTDICFVYLKKQHKILYDRFCQLVAQIGYLYDQMFNFHLHKFHIFKRSNSIDRGMSICDQKLHRCDHSFLKPSATIRPNVCIRVLRVAHRDEP